MIGPGTPENACPGGLTALLYNPAAPASIRLPAARSLSGQAAVVATERPGRRGGGGGGWWGQEGGLPVNFRLRLSTSIFIRARPRQHLCALSQLSAIDPFGEGTSLNEHPAPSGDCFTSSCHYFAICAGSC